MTPTISRRSTSSGARPWERGGSRRPRTSSATFWPTIPRQCYAMVNLGRTYFAAERWVEAEAYLRRAAACAPRMAVVYESLGELYLKLGRTQEAAAAFRRARRSSLRAGPGRLRGAAESPPGTIPVFRPSIGAFSGPEGSGPPASVC